MLLVAITGAVVALASCSGGPPDPPSFPVTNTEPVGNGLKVIAYAMLGATVVVVAGRLIR
jgi:hypothetical protein